MPLILRGFDIQDYATHPPRVETLGYRLKPVKTGSGDVAVLEYGIHARGLFLCLRMVAVPDRPQKSLLAYSYRWISALALAQRSHIVTFDNRV
jgi:hypothetical protein